MYFHQRKRFCHRAASAAICGILLSFAGPITCSQASPQTAPPPRTPSALGTIKSITPDSLTLGLDSGTELKVQLSADVKVVRVPPGSKDLKEAVPLQLSDLQPGDRVLVRSKPGSDASSFAAAMIVAMKKTDIAVKHQKDREEWQRRGIGGLVSSIDPAQNAITIKTMSAAGAKDVVIHADPNTILRRYAPGSIDFDAAKVAPITEIKLGDQLRARGTRSADGAEFTAAEIVSGSFRNIAGIVSAVNAGAGTLTVNDLAAKKPVELRVTTDSQMKKLPDMMAQGIAARLKGMGAGSGAVAPAGKTGGGQPGGAAPPAGAAQGTPAASGNGGPGGPGRGSNGDLQQMLSRLPASPLTDFQKGDAVMVVATSSEGDGPPTIITLLGGVEPILQATSQGQAASILSPWSLNQGGGGDVGTP